MFVQTKMLHPFMVITLAVLPWTAAPQNPVAIQFQVSPVLVASGSDAIFTVQTISDTFSLEWFAPGGTTLGQWIGGQAILNSVPQYQGRVTITANQLKISGSLLSDAGNYTVKVVPSATTGLITSSLSVALRVFDAVSQVSLFVPSMAMEGGNISLSCSWNKGTQTTVVWGKGVSSLPSDSRITVRAGSLIINPASRSDAGQYSCTVSNPVSSQTAVGSLTVYYGPDTPQVTKTSSECVGGGDAVVGQTVRLTCTSVSLPPALLSWQYNGQPLTVSQESGGMLSLQVFSTNQSGTYICKASNSIMAATSQQQLVLSVVSTCLSVGAVAGIAVACFVALVLIIIAIVLILRQRNVYRSLKNVIGLQKTNLNNRPPDLLPPQNAHVTPGIPENGDQPDPPLHNPNRRNLPKNQQGVTSVWYTGQENNGRLMQNDHNNINVLQHNGHLNAGMLPINDNDSCNAQPHNGPQNSNLYPHNGPHNSNSAFPQSGQLNPNILIQTGRTEPGTHTVLINVNTLPDTQQQNRATQPQTVQVSLNAPQTPANQAPQSNTFQQQQASTRQILPQTGEHNAALSAFNVRNSDQVPNRLVQSNQTVTNHDTAERRPRTTNAIVGANTTLRQMPWDLVHGTPAYPNHQSDSSDSLDSQSASRNLQLRAIHGVSPSHSEMALNAQRQHAHLSNHQDTMQHTVSRNSPIPTQSVSHRNAIPQNPTMPQSQATHFQTTPTQHTMPDQRQPLRQSANFPNPVSLTQAALQLHTTQTHNPFLDRNQQTRAALEHPGSRLVPIQAGQLQIQPTPTAIQTNQAGQRAPTPPPVLQPDEFQTLRQESLHQSRTLQPTNIVAIQRPPNIHRHARAMHASHMHRHTGNPTVHVTGHRHGNMHRHPGHTNQVHRTRARF